MGCVCKTKGWTYFGVLDELVNSMYLGFMLSELLEDAKELKVCV